MLNDFIMGSVLKPIENINSFVKWNIDTLVMVFSPVHTMPDSFRSGILFITDRRSIPIRSVSFSHSDLM